jgi:hypothetical protein
VRTHGGKRSDLSVRVLEGHVPERQVDHGPAARRNGVLPGHRQLDLLLRRHDGIEERQKSLGEQTEPEQARQSERRIGEELAPSGLLLELDDGRPYFSSLNAGLTLWIFSSASSRSEAGRLLRCTRKLSAFRTLESYVRKR